MGTWGTAISSNDTFQDIKDEFFDLYNEGREVEEISVKLISENQDLIGSEEDRNDFWFALASCQWECGALNQTILNQVAKIIESKEDLRLWKQLGATNSEISKREKILKKFLEKLKTKKGKPKNRRKKVLRDSIFVTGDCLTFELENGNFGGAFVLKSEKQTQFGMNLIAVCDIVSDQPPTLKDFKKADVLVQKVQALSDKYVDREAIFLVLCRILSGFQNFLRCNWQAISYKRISL